MIWDEESQRFVSRPKVLADEPEVRTPIDPCSLGDHHSWSAEADAEGHTRCLKCGKKSVSVYEPTPEGKINITASITTGSVSYVRDCQHRHVLLTDGKMTCKGCGKELEGRTSRTKAFDVDMQVVDNVFDALKKARSIKVPNCADGTHDLEKTEDDSGIAFRACVHCDYVTEYTEAEKVCIPVYRDLIEVPEHYHLWRDAPHQAVFVYVELDGGTWLRKQAFRDNEWTALSETAPHIDSVGREDIQQRVNKIVALWRERFGAP